MALKKLKTFALAALLLLAGSAQLSASKGGAAELSPNLHIVTKSQKADKKNGPGFVAFLKKSAKGLGQTFVAAVNAQSPSASKVAQKSPARRAGLGIARIRQKSDVRVALPATCLQPASSAAMDFHSNGEPAQLVKNCIETVYIRLFDAKTGSLPPLAPAVASELATLAGLKEDYSLIRSILNLLKPGVSIKPARSPQAQRHPWGLIDRIGRGSAATGRPQSTSVTEMLAPASARNHLTIDPAKAAELLTDGTMGARSALRSHRPRDHRAQSV